jgi:S1-C subfamily serine protease
VHSYLGIMETDMNFQLAQAMNSNVTYGVLVEGVVSGGPASHAGLVAGKNIAIIDGQQYLIGGDVIVSVNGTRVINVDTLATYLEEHTVAGQVVSLGILKGGTHNMTIDLTLGARPPI